MECLVGRMSSTVQITTLSVYPEVINSYTSVGKLANIQIANPYLQINHHSFYEWAPKQTTIDRKCVGGADGMLIKPEIFHDALCHITQSTGKIDKQKTCLVVFVTPQGLLWNQSHARNYATNLFVNHTIEHLVLIGARSAGLDQRSIEHWIDQEISIGDYILFGGELPIAIVLDSVLRLSPNAMRNPVSAVQDSFSQGDMLEEPQYCLPRSWLGQDIPSVLLSGNHKNIQLFQTQERHRVTSLKRPK
jgi:tRNA (guanine37-N1)-methyltransferase